MRDIGDILDLSRLRLAKRRTQSTTWLSVTEAHAVEAELAGKYRRAARLRKRCFAEALEHGRPEAVATQYYKLGLALRATGRNAAALDALSNAVEIGQANSVDALVADAQLAIAGVMLMAKEIDRARSAALTADTLYRKLSPGSEGPTPAARLLNTLTTIERGQK